MKIIDLLNKIANGEEVPKKIKIKTNVLTRFDYSKGDGTYISSYQSDDGQYHINDYSYPQYLNIEVEIIEEHKIPEKLDNRYYDKVNKCYSGFKELKQEELVDKINEILDYLSKEE